MVPSDKGKTCKEAPSTFDTPEVITGMFWVDGTPCMASQRKDCRVRQTKGVWPRSLSFTQHTIMILSALLPKVWTKPCS